MLRAILWHGVFVFDKAKEENPLYNFFDQNEGETVITINLVKKLNLKSKSEPEMVEPKSADSAVKNSPILKHFFINGYYLPYGDVTALPLR